MESDQYTGRQNAVQTDWLHMAKTDCQYPHNLSKGKCTCDDGRELLRKGVQFCSKGTGSQAKEDELESSVPFQQRQTAQRTVLAEVKPAG